MLHAHKEAINYGRGVQGDESFQEREGESFTDVILRLTGNRGSIKRLLEIVDELHSPELAYNIEQASKEFRKNFKLRYAEL